MFRAGQRLVRGFATHAHHGEHREVYHGFVVPHVARKHKIWSQAILQTMYLWFMYRLKEDGLVTFGFKKPWELHHHDHDDHHHEVEWVKPKIGAMPIHKGHDDEEEEHHH